VTGGAAVAGIRETDSHFADGVPTNIANFSKTPAGAVVGVGIEAHLGGNWTAKVEYLHIAFEPIGNFKTLPFLCGGVACAGPFALTTSSAIADNIVRVGLNYRILAGSAVGPAPVAAMPVKSPVPAWSWTGFYVGGNGGYGVGSDPFSQLVTVAGTPGFSTFAKANVAPVGGLLGGQAGYNWQAGAVVLGVEADAQWADLDGQSCGISCPGFFGAAFYPTVSQRLDWFATARGRVGFANDGYLFYVTGGGAFGGVTETDALPLLPAAASFSRNRSGWTAGGGIEARLWGRWSGKLEYLHVDLGSTTNAFTFAAGPTVLSTTSAIRDDLVRVGLNYKVGG